MDLCSFVNNNTKCPICQNDLTLYLQVHNGPCFSSTRTVSKINPDDNLFKFTPFLLKSTLDMFGGKEDNTIDLAARKETYEFNDKKKFLDNGFYLFFVCNKAGFKEIPGDYNIKMYDACYYLSTPPLKIDINNNVQFREQNHTDMMYHESHAYMIQKNEVLKVYILISDYNAKNTKLWYYTMTDKESKTKGWEPNKFSKTLPLVPKFNASYRNKDQLIDRFDSWIILS